MLWWWIVNKGITKNRLALCFEPKAYAKKRQTQNNKEPNQVEIPRDHMGYIDLMTWDKQALKSEVEAYENNHLINWRELATKYHVCNKAGQIASTGGKIVNNWLVSEGLGLSRFRTKRQNSACGA